VAPARTLYTAIVKNEAFLAMALMPPWPLLGQSCARDRLSVSFFESAHFRHFDADSEKLRADVLARN
jgi:hypothetical protein